MNDDRNYDYMREKYEDEGTVPLERFRALEEELDTKKGQIKDIVELVMSDQVEECIEYFKSEALI